jgi:hypothetical protein
VSDTSSQTHAHPGQGTFDQDVSESILLGMDITISTGTYGRLRIRSIRNFGRVRFSLRTLLIGMTLVGLLLGVIVTVMK